MASYQDYLPSRLPPPRGLANYGNTCWLNSLCQMLLSFEPFNRLILNIPKSPGCGMRTAWQIFVKDSNPSRLRSEFSKMLGGGQQCVDEAICMFLDALNSGPATGMLRIVVNQYTKCECGEVIKQRDPMYRIVIHKPLPLLQSLCENIVPLSDFRCKCGQSIKSRIEALGRVENAIIVTFQQYGAKTLYDFPQELTIGSTEGPPHKFELVAQIEHSGNTSFGHYWARVRREGGIFLINDDHIEPSHFEPTPATYMVAYFRK